MILSNSLLLAMLVVVCLLFGIVAAALAARKGYSFAAWFGAGGLVLLAAIALGFLPSVRDPSLPPAEREKALARGNLIGLALSLLTLSMAFFGILARLLAFSVVSGGEESQFFEYYYAPANQFLTWVQFLTLVVVLSAYVASPRHPKSLAVVLSLALLALVDLYFSLVPLFDHLPIATRLPVQLKYSSDYFARVLSYFGIVGLCVGILSAHRPKASVV